MGNFLEEIIEKDLAEGKVDGIITRYPPEPNGYPHIGHAKSICLNYGLAKKYNGKFNLRFDDTNPVKEDIEFVNAIANDVKWLGAEFEVFFASDYFDVMYECAVKLIKKGLAYIDDITPDQLREQRGTLTTPGQNSRHRNRPIEESLQLFDDMKNGKIADGKLVLRAKIDMASPNVTMRDPVIYRVLHAHHHRQGDKWCIYPMYDFAHPIEDAVEGITHSICTLEFENNRPLYDWFLENCDFDPRPHQYEFARLNIERTVMSKRYLKKLVDEGFVEGWDDPRMPTLAGLRRRGYTPSSIIEFCERVGVAKANSEVQAGQLESCIRDELNISAPRAMAVIDPIELVITNRDDNYSEQIDFEYSLGEQNFSRKISISNKLYVERSDFALDPPPKFHRLKTGGLVRLKGAYIIECTDAQTDENGVVSKIFAKIIEGTKSGQGESSIKAKGVIHFVDAKNCVDAAIRLYDYLLTAENAGEDFSKRLNDKSLVVMNSKLEKHLDDAKKGERFQFLRQGYFIRDEKLNDLVFNQIVGLKDSYNK
ncbi:glutamine-trna ligase [Holotrichia oblita]|nr:glutamine-trna ligase [Holotrichia oblita]